MSFTKSTIQAIRNADQIIFELAGGLGPWIVPAAQGILYGGAFKIGLENLFGQDIALAAGVSAAVGIIIAGAYTSHNAVNRGGWRRWSLPIAVTVLEIIGVWAMGESHQEVAVAGTVTAIAAMILYIARADSRSILDERQSQAEADNRQFEQEMIRDQANKAHERQMAQDKLRAELEKAKLAPVVQTSVVPIKPESSEPPEYRSRIKAIVARYGDQEIGVGDIMETTGLGKTQAHSLINYATESGDLHKVRHGKYQMNGK